MWRYRKTVTGRYCPLEHKATKGEVVPRQEYPTAEAVRAWGRCRGKPHAPLS